MVKSLHVCDRICNTEGVYRARETERDRLREEIVNLLRSYSVEAQHVGHTFAQRHGLHPTDLQALIAVMHAEGRGDPLTPGRLGEAIGLSSGATTAAIDRLERAGHLRRTRESSDRRVVHLRYGEPGMALAREFFGPLGKRTDDVMAGYSDEDLALVRRFLQGMNDALTEHHVAVRAADRPRPGVGGDIPPLSASR
jgi:DNA-binding MarR family transcriptional regulator